MRKALHQRIRARGGIAIVIAHRPSAIAAVDLVLMMVDGRVKAFGPKDEVLQKVLEAPSRPVTTLRDVSEAKSSTS